MSDVARKGLVVALRQRISDDRATATAFSLSVTGEAKSALVELSAGVLRVTLSGSSVRGIGYSLSNPLYSTVGRLIAALGREAGYQVTPDNQHQPDHPSSDLRIDVGLADIANGKGVVFRHPMFSDQELREFLAEAIALHNPNYALNTVPLAEQPYILTKASARAYQVIASDAAKRRGLATDAKVFLQLAQDLERQYTADTRRMARVLPATRIDESKIGTGNVVVGTMTRRSLRAGYMSPYRANQPIDPPTMYEPSDDDAEDTMIRVRWSQNRDYSFSYYELWRDTQANVERSIGGRLEAQNNLPQGVPVLAAQSQFSRASTSVQVFGLNNGSNQTSPIYDGYFFWTFAELSGGGLVNVMFIDGLVAPSTSGGAAQVLGTPLEPEMTYYYRIYGIDWNGEVIPSNVVRITTRKMRASFQRSTAGTLAQDAISPTSGPLAGGTVLTLTGAWFVAGDVVLVGGKVCPIVSVTPNQLVCTTPGFTNPDFVGKPQDVVLVSPTGLKDIAKTAWVYL